MAERTLKVISMGPLRSGTNIIATHAGVEGAAEFMAELVTAPAGARITIYGVKVGRYAGVALEAGPVCCLLSMKEAKIVTQTLESHLHSCQDEDCPLVAMAPDVILWMREVLRRFPVKPKAARKTKLPQAHRSSP